MNNRIMLPSPSRDVLSNDRVTGAAVASPIDPELHINQKVPVGDVAPEVRYFAPSYSAVNTMRSLFDVVQTLWWPSESTWQKVHAPLFRSEVPQQYAAMPMGALTPGIYDRSNLRQPAALTQGGLQSLADQQAAPGGP